MPLQLLAWMFNVVFQMSTDKYELLLPDIDYKGDKVVLEYVFINHTGYELCTKSRVVEKEPRSVEGKQTSLLKWKPENS